MSTEVNKPTASPASEPRRASPMTGQPRAAPFTAEPAPHAGERPTAAAPPGARAADLAPLAESLRRVERTLEEIHGTLESDTRARRYREFSLARLIGTILQTFAVLLVIFALADWAFDAHPVQQLVKIAFAGVLQLGALTAFLLARERT